MTADEFIGYLQYVVDRDDSKYRSGGVWSVGQYAYDEADGKYHIYFDCNGLGESIVATRGKIVTNTDPNLNPWNLWDENIGVVSGGDTWFEEVCIDKSTDFSNLVPGEWLVYYKRGEGTHFHFGYYIGNNKVIESNGWAGKVVVSTIDSSGHDSIQGSSWKWDFHAKAPWISYTPSYISKCEYIPAHVKATITASGGAPVWSLPCNSNTNSNSQKLGTLSKGTVIEAVAMYKNTAGTYWYQVNYNGKTGYVWCNHTEKKEVILGTATATGGNSVFSTLEKGKAYGVKWRISAQYAELYKVAGVIQYSGWNDNANVYYQAVSLSGRFTSYQLGGEVIDNALLFDQLATGTYRTYISAYVRNYYWDSSTNSIKSEVATRTLKDFTFTVVEAGTTTYYLDLNGYLDGNNDNSIEGYGTADIYITQKDGTVIVEEGVNDYYKAWPTGTKYEIKNIQGVWGHKYNSVNSGSLSGTIGSSNVAVRLSFSTITGNSNPVSTITYAGHTYERYDYNNLSWTEAKAFCASKGGYLVTITDAEEQRLVKDLLNNCQFGVYYIGLTDAESEGNWKWVTREAFNYSNWDPSSPEPTNYSGENYGAIIGIDNPPNKQVGEWIDAYNDYTERNFYNKANCGFICEYGDYEAESPGVNVGTDFYAYFIHLSSWKHLENKDNNVRVAAGNHGVPQQIWHFLRQSDGSYKIVNEYNGGLLTAENGMSYDGMNVLVSEEDTGAKTQRWYIQKTGDGHSIFCLANNKAMDLQDGSTASGTNVWLYTPNSSSAQTFRIYDILKEESKQYVKPGKPSTPKLSYSISGKTVNFTWTASPSLNEWDGRQYELEIISADGTSRFVTGLTGTTHSETMSDGTYTVKLRAVSSGYDRNSAAAVISDPSTVQFMVGTVTYIVSYNANGGTGAPAAQTKPHGQTLTLATAKPSRDNDPAGSYTVTLEANGGNCSTTSLDAAITTIYTFKNWNTSASGNGTAYASGASYTTDASVILFAQWNSNITTASVTLPTPTREGHIFKGWATSSDATSGSTGSYTPVDNVTLYAIWKANEYSVSYDANGGSGAPDSQTKTHDVDLTLSSTKPTRADTSAGSYTVTLNANGGSCDTTSLTAARTTKYTFKNWNTAANGSGTSYSAGATYSNNASATLYAQWNSSTTTAAVTLPTPTWTGHTFKGWATSSTATSGSTGSYTPSGNVTLYAIWQQDEPTTYTIEYNANGGTGAPANQIKTHDVDLTLSSTKPTRANASAGSYTVTLNANGGSCDTTSLTAARTTKYTFKNWNTAANGSGTSYNSSATYSANASATLYAQWNSSTSTAAVTLPTPTWTGHTFKGWATSSTATSGSTGSYTPSGNVTLYAIWEQDTQPPVIITQPEDITVAAGKTATFTVVAEGTGLSYQWYVQLKGSEGWDPISSATKDTLSFTADSVQNGRRYRCEVSNDKGTVSSEEAKLTVVTKPKITTQPKAASVKAGKKVTFKVKATGGELTYQWYYQKKGTTKWVKISKATKATYSFTVKKSQNGYKYRCTVTNAAGKVNSKAVKLTVK